MANKAGSRMRTLGIAGTVILYLSILSLAVVFLASVQRRSAAGTAYDTWKLNYRMNMNKGKVIKEELKSAKQKQAKDKAWALDTTYCLQQVFDTNGNVQTSRVSQKTMEEAAKAKQEETSESRPGGTNLGVPLYCLVSGYPLLKYFEAQDKMTLEEDSLVIKAIEKQVDSNEKQHAELIKGHQDFVAFSTMPDVFYEPPFLPISYDLLVLLLVIMMGAIGGMVRVLRDYGASGHPNPSYADYLLMPPIGAVVAVGGYVLAKTGLLLLSSEKGETSLSPYMVSLVGIISGLLANEVVSTIAASGRKMMANARLAAAQRERKAAAAQRGRDKQ